MTYAKKLSTGIKVVALSAIALVLASCDDKKAAAPAASNTVGDAPAGSNAPAPRIVVVNRAAILQESKVGQDMYRQVQEYTRTAENELKGQQAQLRNEAQQIQQQTAIASAAVKDQRMRDFQRKQASLQQLAEKKQAQIQGGIRKAQVTVEETLGPILQEVMKERGGNLLMDRQAIVLSTIDIDITKAVIQKLDSKMASIKLELVDPPQQPQQPSQPPQQ